MHNKRHGFRKLKNSNSGEQVYEHFTIASHSKCIHPRAIIPHSLVINEFLKDSFHRTLAVWIRTVGTLPRILISISILCDGSFFAETSSTKWRVSFFSSELLYRSEANTKILQRFINLIRHSDFLRFTIILHSSKCYHMRNWYLLRFYMQVCCNIDVRRWEFT